MVEERPRGRRPLIAGSYRRATGSTALGETTWVTKARPPRRPSSGAGSGRGPSKHPRGGQAILVYPPKRNLWGRNLGAIHNAHTCFLYIGSAGALGAPLFSRGNRNRPSIKASGIPSRLRARGICCCPKLNPMCRWGLETQLPVRTRQASLEFLCGQKREGVESRRRATWGLRSEPVFLLKERSSGPSKRRNVQQIILAVPIAPVRGHVKVPTYGHSKVSTL